MRPYHVGGKKIVIAFAAAALLLAAPLAAQAKKLQVSVALADIHLNADLGSPVIETLVRGAVMTLASAIKTRTNWFYVYFVSAASGKTRGGYITDDLVQKLYPELKIVQISSEDEISRPMDLDFTATYRPVIEWGVAKEKIFEAEGRPLGQEKVEGVEIITYKRRVMARQCLVEYVFDGDRLATTRLSLLENFADKNQYIQDYLKIKDFTVSRIGEPKSDEVVWQDSTLKGDDRLWGKALSVGQLEFSSRWDIPGAELRIKLAGGQNRVALGIEFSGTDLKSASI